jgi:hypothetical protein
MSPSHSNYRMTSRKGCSLWRSLWGTPYPSWVGGQDDYPVYPFYLPPRPRIGPDVQLTHVGPREAMAFFA